MNIGLLVTFEGGEGSGKTSVIEEIVDWLRFKGIEVANYREPGGTKIGEEIRNILHDTNNREMSPKTEALLYQAARAQLYEEKIFPRLKEGGIVLLDRSIDSSTVYQGDGRGLGEEIIEQLNEFSTDGFKPDLTILLDIEPEIGLKRRVEGKGEMNRLDLENLEFHKDVRKAYQLIARDNIDGRWRVVDAREPFEEVLERVKTLLEEELIIRGFLEKENKGKER